MYIRTETGAAPEIRPAYDLPMAPRKNPRYRPMPPGWKPDKPSVGAGILASPAGPPEKLERPVYPERPLSRPQADMLRPAAAGTALISIAGRYASIVTLRHLRERGHRGRHTPHR